MSAEHSYPWNIFKIQNILKITEMKTSICLTQKFYFLIVFHYNIT